MRTLKRKVSCTFKREIPPEIQERIYQLFPGGMVPSFQWIGAGGERSSVESLEEEFSRIEDSLQSAELFQSHAQLSKNFEQQRRPNLTAAMKRNRHGTSIRVIPAFVTPCLSCLSEAQAPRGVLKLTSRGARHERFRWCQRVAEFPFRNILPRAFGRRSRVPRALLRG